MNIVHHESNHSIVLLDTKRYHRPHLKKVPKKINWSNSKLERIFNPSKDEVLRSNDEKFVKWVMKQLRATGKTVTPTENYNACALHLSQKNLDELHDFLNPMIYLNYSPTTANALPDNILGIDPLVVVVKRI